MSICPKCDGSGLLPGKNLGEFRVCDLCKGSGQEYEQQTNEEWFTSLSTEEKAEWLSNRDEFIYDCGQRGVTPKIMDKDEWVEWLKTVHK